MNILGAVFAFGVAIALVAAGWWGIRNQATLLRHFGNWPPRPYSRFSALALPWVILVLGGFLLIALTIVAIAALVQG